MYGLGLVSPISEMEIAQELSYRNYATGQAPAAQPTTISRADCIKAGVNRALDQRGMARKASSLTYIDVLAISYLIQDAKNYANAYLDGSQTPSSNLLSGFNIRGLKMRLGNINYGLATLGQYAVEIPAPILNTPSPAQTGVSGWWILLSILGNAAVSYSQYQMSKDYLASKGYGFPTTTSTQYDYYKQYLAQNPNLTPEQVQQLLNPYQQKKETPVWVWAALGIAAVYVLMSTMQRKPE